MSMAARGSGPSRRSHTKSRKGCKTCKRRHIRCDEAHPQCTNCTKHHVRCDYLDATTPEAESFTTASSEHASPITGDTYDMASVSCHSRTNSAYSDFGLAIMTEPEQLYGDGAHLLQNLHTIADDLDAKGTSNLTAWVSTIRRHLNISSPFDYMVDALKAFSASQLAWLSQSTEIREKSIQYSTSALSGLHRAVGSFNKSNSDAVFATALLLSSQSKDWLSWSSLVGGIASITAAIEAWQDDSVYSDLVGLVNTYTTLKKAGPENNAPVSSATRTDILDKVSSALQSLRSQLIDRPVEIHWADQLIDLISRLQTTEPARTPEEQFNHLYVLRKWVMWLPVFLLQDGPTDLPKLNFLAHLYATALAIEQLFPQLGAELCANLACQPLANVLARMADMQGEHSELSLFTQSTLDQFNQRSLWAAARPCPSVQVPDISMWFTEESGMPGNLSPAFNPIPFEAFHSRASSAASMFLEVPTPQHHVDYTGFSHNTAHWGTFPSPIFPTDEFSTDGDFFFSNQTLAKSNFDEFGGYIQPCEIWTS